MNKINNITFSNLLIVFSFIITILAFSYNNLYSFWINNHYFDIWLYHIYIIQFFTGNFLHGNIMHIFFNSMFLYFFGNIVEWLIWRKKMILFFIFCSIFIWVILTNITNINTIGISWFCMAIISFYTLELKSKNNPEYKWWITAIIINIGIGFLPWISLYGHLLGAIAWVLFYLFIKDFFIQKYIWLASKS
jgi:membrane associated rhomboid family serine protease